MSPLLLWITNIVRQESGGRKGRVHVKRNPRMGCEPTKGNVQA